MKYYTCEEKASFRYKDNAAYDTTVHVPYRRNLSRGGTFMNFTVSKQFAKVSTEKISTENGGVIINGCVIILDNGDSVGLGIMDVASLSLARQYVSYSSFPNQHVDMVASINSGHFRQYTV